MALLIHIRKGQQAIVNGAVLENVSGRTVSLAVRNEAAILRADDILSPEAAHTPACRVYLALQCAYLFPDRRDEHLREFHRLIDEYVAAAPSAQPIVRPIVETLQAGQLYPALKLTQVLIQHEGKVLAHAEERLADQLRNRSAAGQSAGDGGLGANPDRIAPEGRV